METIFNHRLANALVFFLATISFQPKIFATFSKLDAYQMLQKSSLKWKLNDSLTEDAEIKNLIAESGLRPKIALAAKQYYAKINPISYGQKDDQTVDQVAFGTTGLEMTWTLIDPVAKAEGFLTKSLLDSSRQQVIQNRNDLTALMLFQYLNVQRIGRQLLALDANIEKSKLILRLAQARQKVGAGIPLDVARAKNLFELDRLKKISAFNKYLKAKHALTTLLGEEKEKEALEPLMAKKLDKVVIASFTKEAFANRADLKSAEFNVKASQEAVKQTDTLLFPKLAVLAEIGTTQATALGLPAKTATGLVGVSLTIPLETGGFITAKKREAVSMLSKSQLQLKETQLEVLSQSKEALEQILSAEEALDASEDYVKTVEEEASIAEKRFSQGSSNILDYTSSHTNLSNAQDTLTESIYNYELAKINFYKTKGSFDGYFSM